MASPYGAPPGYAPPPVRRRRRRWPWVLLTVVALLIALFVVVDRVALSIAESKAAQTLQDSQHLDHEPDVSVAGFPFLTQLAAGQFGEVTISAPDVTVGGNRQLQISKVTVHLHDVTVFNSYRSVRAVTATAAALITYADLSRTLHVPVHRSGPGRLEADPSVQVLGQTISGRVSAVVHASSSQGISFTDLRISAAGIPLPDAATRALGDVLATPISLAGLPFSIRVDGVDVTSSGIVLRLSGRDLVYTRS